MNSIFSQTQDLLINILTTNYVLAFKQLSEVIVKAMSPRY